MPVVDANEPSVSGAIAVGEAPPVTDCQSARTTVPALSNATIQNRNGTVFAVPSVAPTALVLMLVAAVTVRQIGPPLAIVESRNGIRTGSPALGSAPATVLMATVRMLDPTEAVSPKLIGALKP